MYACGSPQTILAGNPEEVFHLTTVQLQGYIEGCSIVVSLSVGSNVVFAMLHLAENLNVNTMHTYKH